MNGRQQGMMISNLLVKSFIGYRH